MSDSLLELLATPPAPPMSVDELAVYAGGRARVRRRGWLRGGLAGATAVALATMVWANLPTGTTSDLRPGATATTRVVSTNCSDTGTPLGESGPLIVGEATVSLRARAGTCEGIRVETSYTIPGYSETGLIGSGHNSPLRAVFTIVGMQEMGLARVRPATALIVLPPGEQICSLTHAGRPHDDLRDRMAAAQTESWAAGWTFVAQPLPADAAQWEWRLQVCGSGRTLVPANLPPRADPSDVAHVSGHPTPASLTLDDGDTVLVGHVDPESWAIPLTLTDAHGNVLARELLPPMTIPDGPSTTKGWDDSGTSGYGPWLAAGHSLAVQVGGPISPTNTFATTCGPAVKVTTARTVVVPGSTLRLSVFDVRALDGGPATAASLTGSDCTAAGRS
jgi:hypothetical protein